MAPLPGAAPASLPAPWQLPFELAWEALRAGSRPVGPVLYDPEGQAVTGRVQPQNSVLLHNRQGSRVACSRGVRRPAAGPVRRAARAAVGGVRYGSQRSPEGAGAREARRLLDAGVLTAPTAEAAYALIAPSLVG
jgi:hypothetical protein